MMTNVDPPSLIFLDGQSTVKKRDESPLHTSFFSPIKIEDRDDSISSHILARAPNPKGHLYRHASSLPFPAQIGHIDLGEKSKKN